MSITKAQVIEAIKAMPQEGFADVDELLAELITVTKIEKGLKDIEEGRVVSEEEMDKLIQQW